MTKETISRDIYCCDGRDKEEMVISGIAGRFSGCDSIDEVVETIFNDDASPLCAKKSDRYKREYFEFTPIATLKDVAKMDAEVARMTAFAARSMDPQMRLAHEVVYEVLVDAGYTAAELSGRDIAVYAAIDRTDFMDILYQEDFDKDIGIERCVRCHYANYVSFTFNFTGPSYVMCTEESSVLNVLSRAMLDIKLGLCESAVVLSHHIQFNSEFSKVFTEAGYLPVDETDTPLAFKGQGFAYGECVGALFIQKAETARRVYATVMNIETVTEGLLVRGAKLSKSSMKKLLDDTYKKCDVKPQDVSYLECDWMVPQMSLRDETDVLSEYFCSSRQGPLSVGSAKWNFGHCGASSGICALLNVILCMEHGKIPPTRTCDARLLKCPAVEKGQLKIVSKPTPFNGSFVGLTSFAMSGVAVHACLKKNQLEQSKATVTKSCVPRLVTFSSRTKEGVENFFNYLQENAVPDELFSLVQKVVDKGEFHTYRGFRLLQEKECSFTIKEIASPKRPVWFLFNSIKSLWKEISLNLMNLEAFSDSMNRSAEILKSIGIDISTHIKASVLTTSQNDKSTFALQWALQIAFVDLLKTVGVSPDKVIGFSLADSICGYAAETCDRAACLKSIGMLVKALEATGSSAGQMVTVELGWEEMEKRCPANIHAACHLDEKLTIISGLPEAMKQFLGELKKENITFSEFWSFGMPLHTSHLSSVISSLDKLPKEDSTDYFSEKWIRSHEYSDEKASTISYLSHNLVSPTYFYDTLLQIPENAIVIEIGPHCSFENLIKTVVGQECEYLSLMAENEDSLLQTLSTIGRLYTLGINPEIENLYPPAKFPVPRSVPMLSSFVKWKHDEDLFVCHHYKSAISFKVCSKNPATAYLADYCIQGQNVLPASGYLVFAWQVLADRLEKSLAETPVVFENIRFVKATVLRTTGTNALQMFMLNNLGNFTVYENGTLVMTGELKEFNEAKVFTQAKEVKESDESGEPQKAIEHDPRLAKEWLINDTPVVCSYVPREPNCRLSRQHVYENLNSKGFECGMPFQNICEADINGKQGLLQWDQNWITFLQSVFMFPCIFKDGKGHMSISKIRHLKIHPAELQQFLKEDAQKKKAVPLVFDAPLSKYKTPGAEVTGLAYNYTPLHVAKDRLAFKEYLFVPFEAKFDLHQKFENYATSCKQEANRLNSAILNDGKTEALELPCAVNDILKCNQVLLTALKSAYVEVCKNKDVKKSLKLFQNYLNNIQNDALCKTVLEVNILQSVLNVIEQNITSRKINVLEVTNAFHPLSLHIWATVCKSNMDWDFTIVHPTPGDIGFNYQKQNIHVQTQISPDTCKHVVVGSFLHGTTENLEEYMVSLLSNVAAQDYVLFLFRSDITAAEKTLRNLCVCDMEMPSVQELEKFLKQQKLVVLSRQSDNLGLHIYLFRKHQHIKKQVIHVLNEDNKGWIADVKKAFKVIESDDHSRLWIVVPKAPTTGVIGIVKYLQTQPGGENIRCLFICNQADDSPFDVKNPVYALAFERDLAFNVLRNGVWGCYQHFPFQSDNQPIESSDCSLSLAHVGHLSSIRWIHSPTVHTNREHSTLPKVCQVYYAGVSFYDVMIANGDIVDAFGEQLGEKYLGHEFSGRDSAGKRVFGLAPNSISSSVVPITKLLWSVPDSWTLQQACTVPLAYSVAYYALFTLADVDEGKSVLIHCGSGGLGQALINIALSMDCEVFTTAGSEEKKEYLKSTFPQLNSENIGVSRNSTFRDMVLEKTDGNGVDIVLNTLPEEDMTDSYTLVAYHGCIVDFRGKIRDGSRFIGLKHFLRNISLFQISLSHFIQCADPDDTIFAKSVQNLVQEGIEKGVVKPLDVTVFNRSEAVHAFQFLSAARHLGKVLIKIRDEESVAVCLPEPQKFTLTNSICLHPEKYYFVLGNNNGTALAFAEWLGQMGAKKIVLHSSSIDPSLQSICLERWKTGGVETKFVKMDINDAQNLRKLVSETGKLGHVGGIFYIAEIDASVDTSVDATVISRGSVLKSLDCIAREMCSQLDWFVCITSSDPNRTNLLQTYEESLAAMVCEQRTKDKLHGLALQWENTKIVPSGSDGNSIHSLTMLFSALAQSMVSKKPVIHCKIEQENSPNYEADACSDVFEELHGLLGKVLEQQRKPDIYVGMSPDNQLLQNEDLITKMNKINSGTPIFIVLPVENIDHFKEFYASMASPVFALPLSSDILEGGVKDLAKFLLKEISKDFTKSEIHLIGYGFGALVAFEMALQCENSLAGVMRIQSLISINGLHILNQITQSNFGSNISLFSEINDLLAFLTPWFYEEFAKIEKRVANFDNPDSCLTYIADQLFDLNGREMDREEILSCLQSEILKRRIVQKYVPMAKLQLDVTLIESQKLIGDGVTKEKLGLEKMCSGDVKACTIAGDVADLLKQESCAKVVNIIDKNLSNF